MGVFRPTGDKIVGEARPDHYICRVGKLGRIANVIPMPMTPNDRFCTAVSNWPIFEYRESLGNIEAHGSYSIFAGQSHRLSGPHQHQTQR